MASAEVRLRLEGGCEEGGVRHYAPGDTIAGVVSVDPEEVLTCRHLWVRVRWHSGYSQDVLAEIDLFSGALRPGDPFTGHFEAKLPRQPWSYDGRIVKIVWEVEVVVDVPWGKDPRHAQPFVVGLA